MRYSIDGKCVYTDVSLSAPTTGSIWECAIILIWTPAFLKWDAHPTAFKFQHCLESNESRLSLNQIVLIVHVSSYQENGKYFHQKSPSVEAYMTGFQPRMQVLYQIHLGDSQCHRQGGLDSTAFYRMCSTKIGCY